MGRVSSMGGVVPAHVTRQRRQARRVVWDVAGIGAAVISELGAGRFASVNLTMARVSSVGHGRRAVVVMLRGRKKRVVGRRLQRVVVSDVVDLRIGARVMALVCLARLGGVVPAHITRQRRRSSRVVWDLAGIGAAVISELGAGRFATVNLTMGRVSSMGGVVPAQVIRERRQSRRLV